MSRIADLLRAAEAVESDLEELQSVLEHRTAFRIEETSIRASAEDGLASVATVAVGRRSWPRSVAGRAWSVAPLLLLLGVVLAAFPHTEALWFQTDSAAAGTGTGTFSCQPLKETVSVLAAVDGNAHYDYTLTGGGPNPNTCNEIVWISLAVCTDLDPTTQVLNETHPSSWTFTPQATELRWTSVSAGSGPLDEEFTFELAGDAEPVDTVARVLLNTPNAQPIELADHVDVPCPVTADAPVANNKSVANTSLNTAANDGVTGGYTGPVATATPTNTPTPTATPKSGKFDKPVGVAIYPATATPVPTKVPAPTATPTTAAPPTDTPAPPPPTPTSPGSN